MRKRSLIVSIIIIALINIGIFVVVNNYSSLFWINYSFTMSAILISAYYICFAFKNEKYMGKLNIMAVVSIYSTCEIIAGLVCSAFDKDHQAVVIVIHLIIVGIFIVFLSSTLSANDFIKNQQKKRECELLNFRYVIEKMKNIQHKIQYTASYKKDIDKAYDSISSGQTSSSPEVEPLEREIITAIDDLNTAVDNNNEQLIISTCDRLNRLCSERNSKLKLRSNF